MKNSMKLGLAALALVGTGLMTSSAQNGKIKAAFIYIGPVGDYGWTYAHEQARLEMQKAVPGIETVTVESVPEGQAAPFLDKVVKDGAKVVFTTSFGYMDGTLEAAKKYPDVIFAHASGYKRNANMATYMADFYQVYYLNGMMAGALTKSNKIGYVGAFPISEVKRHINAFAMGARAVNPKATVNVRWINAWFNPAAAKEASEALISEGVDAMAFTEDTPTVVQTADKKGVMSFGHYTPMGNFAPKTVVSGQIVDWSKIYIDFMKNVVSGKYTTKNLQDVDYWWLLSKKAVKVGYDENNVVNPLFVAALKAKMVGKVSAYTLIMTRLGQMSKAKPNFDPYTGPIKDRKGVVRVAAGKTLNPGELTSLEWAASGVVGQWENEPK
jgi:basic membrane protein A and related proteins